MKRAHVVGEEEVSREVARVRAAGVDRAGHDRPLPARGGVVYVLVVGGRGGLGSPLLRVLGGASREIPVPGGPDIPLVAGPAVIAARRRHQVDLLPLLPADVADRRSGPLAEGEPERVAQALRVELGADVGEVVVRRAEGVAGQPHAVPVDVDDLAGEALLVVGAQRHRIDARPVRCVAVAEPQRPVGRGAHRADRVRVHVGRDAVHGVRRRRTRRRAHAPEDHRLGRGRVVVGDRDSREP